MNYDKIILEMQNKIFELEERVKVLEERNCHCKKNMRISHTDSARDYIQQRKKEAKDKGLNSIIIVASEIHDALGLKNKVQCICNAMYKEMNDKDEVLFQTNSGASTTLKIKYYIE